MPSVEGLRENRTEEGIPYVVGVHVDWGVVEGRREKRLQLASVGGGGSASKRWRQTIWSCWVASWRAGERRDCSGQAMEAVLNGLGVPAAISSLSCPQEQIASSTPYGVPF